MQCRMTILIWRPDSKSKIIENSAQLGTLSIRIGKALDFSTFVFLCFVLLNIVFHFEIEKAFDIFHLLSIPGKVAARFWWRNAQPVRIREETLESGGLFNGVV